MIDRLTQLYDSSTTRDVVEIAILAVAIFIVLRLLGKTRGAGIVRGLGLLVVGLFLVAQVVIASFDLTVLGRVLDYLLTTVLLGLLVIFQPELRRGLMVLGRSRILRYFVRESQYYPMSDKLAEAAESMSRECIGALIVIEREMALAQFIETGDPLDAEVSANLLRLHLLQAQPAARRGRHPQRGPNRRRRLPVAPGPTARGGEHAHGHETPIGLVHERGNRRGPAGGQRGNGPYFRGGGRKARTGAAREPVVSTCLAHQRAPSSRPAPSPSRARRGRPHE